MERCIHRYAAGNSVQTSYLRERLARWKDRTFWYAIWKSGDAPRATKEICTRLKTWAETWLREKELCRPEEQTDKGE